MNKPAPNLTVSEHQIERRVFRVLLTGVVIVGLFGLVIAIAACLILLPYLS